jgi:hypothetical protein
VDVHLKRLADASLAVSEVEEAIAEGAFHLASERLDAARDGLAELRGRWPEMSPAERSVVGASAKPIRQRVDAAARMIPKASALSDAAPVVDPEQEVEPASQ